MQSNIRPSAFHEVTVCCIRYGQDCTMILEHQILEHQCASKGRSSSQQVSGLSIKSHKFCNLSMVRINLCMQQNPMVLLAVVCAMCCKQLFKASSANIEENASKMTHWWCFYGLKLHCKKEKCFFVVEKNCGWGVGN